MSAVKAAVLLFLAVLVQVSILGGYSPLGGSPDVLLVVLLSIALLRGSIFGAIAGFGAGFLVDMVLYAFGALVLRFVLGDAVPAHDVVAALPAEVLWNLLLTWPIYGLVRRLFPPSELSDRAYEVRLLG